MPTLEKKTMQGRPSYDALGTVKSVVAVLNVEAKASPGFVASGACTTSRVHTHAHFGLVVVASQSQVGPQHRHL